MFPEHVNILIQYTGIVLRSGEAMIWPVPLRVLFWSGFSCPSSHGIQPALAVFVAFCTFLSLLAFWPLVE